MTRAIPSLIAALLVAGCAVVPEPEGPSTAVPYRALGTEPFWSLVLDGGRATFESPDAAPVVLPLPPGRASFNCGFRKFWTAVSQSRGQAFR